MRIRSRRSETETLSELKSSRKSMVEAEGSADSAQIKGIDLFLSGLSKLRRSASRYVTDFELKAISEVLGMSYEELLG